tara:strand:+ start:842 stop:976 length:135 start_codon:yes stop_codon:yes gene_type:complete
VGLSLALLMKKGEVRVKKGIFCDLETKRQQQQQQQQQHKHISRV